MRYGSVCSGIEAATAAWHPLGWQPAFFSEIEAFPRAVLEHRYPDVPLHGDFTTIETNQYGKIDLLVGGTPCQSFSVAGLRGGLDDDRGNLALEFCRLAQREQPRWIVWENVPGVLSSGGGRDFGSILGALEDLGYGLAYRVLDAQYFGVAQRRRRVFVVGYLGDWRPAAAVLFERHSMSGHPAPSREARQDAASAAATGAGERGGDGHPVGTFECGGIGAYSSSSSSSPLLRSGADLGHGCEALVTASCVAFDDPRRYNNIHGGSGEHRDAHPTLEATNPKTVVALAQNTRDEVRLFGGDGSLVGALAAQPGMKQTSYVAYLINTQLGLRGVDTSNSTREGIGLGGENDPAYTLQAGHSHAVAFTTEQTPKFNEECALTLTKQSPTGGGQPKAVLTTPAVRRLTPVECERLQGFPDGFTAIPWRKKGAEDCPDGPRYKALGNSMAVPCMRWIGERIQLVDDLIAIL